MKQNQYKHYFFNKAGIKKAGTIIAPNRRIAKARLIHQKIHFINIQRQFQWLQPKIKPKNIQDFFTQLSTLIAAGIPILESLCSIIQTTKHATLKKLIQQIQRTIESGHPLSEAIHQHKKIFNELSYQLIFVGEETGSLDIMLNRIAEHQKKSQQLKSKVKKALFYPCAVTLIAIFVAAVMLIFIVPQFSALFADFGAPLPLPTRCIIHLSNFLSKTMPWLILYISVVIILFQILKKRYPNIQHNIDRLLLKTPLIGKLIYQKTAGLIFRLFHAAYDAGIPVLTIIQLLKKFQINHSFQLALQQIENNLSLGKSLHQSFKTTALFSPTTLQMLAVGEESGKLDQMLNSIANLYEHETERLLERFQQWLEPAMMTFLGLVIGGLVIAMYLPMFKLGTVI